MEYDELMADRRDRIPREDAAESRRVRRESRVAFDKTEQETRRTVRAVAMLFPIPERIAHASRVLDASGIFLPSADLERLAREVADDYCGADASRGIR
jgi:hypothetical protein